MQEINKSKSADPKAGAILKAKIKRRLNEKGYITFDQTLSIAKQCLSKGTISRVLSNRLQFLFVDEFQDSGNDIYTIIEALRKNGKTSIYCVGDPEQYIQSFDSSIKFFKYIPILKAADGTGYNVKLNHNNYRSTENIITFLNNFNGRIYGKEKFAQVSAVKETEKETAEKGQLVVFIPSYDIVKPIIEKFYTLCDSLKISKGERCIMAKRNEVINRIVSAVDNHYMNPKKNANTSPIKAIEDALLSTLQLNQAQFCEKYSCDLISLRKHTIKIFKAIHNGHITNENTFAVFVQNVLNLTIQKGLPVKVENLRFDFGSTLVSDTVTVANIHTMKGLEAKAVLAIAKTEEELLLWLETNHAKREKMRDKEKTDYPRLGYVAFSRAEKLLCIACLEKISSSTIARLNNLNVSIYSEPI